jgi:hypothetical protein
VPSIPPPEYDDCEVITNCVFDASRDGAKVFSVQIELDATPSNGVDVVFGRDVVKHILHLFALGLGAVRIRGYFH